MAAVSCQGETRRLMDRGAAGVGRANWTSIDKLDSCSEHLAGLGAVFCVTLFIWVLALPFFDLGTRSWIKSWETPFSGPPLITVSDFRKRVGKGGYGTPQQFFRKIDVDKDDSVNWGEFVNGAKTVVPPLDESEARIAFDGLDTDGDSKIACEEFEKGLEGTTSTLASKTNTSAATTGQVTTTQERTTSAQQQGPPVASAPAPAPATVTTVSSTRVASIVVETSSTAETTQAPTTEAPTTQLTSSTQTATTTVITTTTLTTLTTVTTTTTMTTTIVPLDTGPISMAQFKARMGPALRDSPRDAFAALDKNNDQKSQLDEFVNATEKLNPPLSIMQAEDVFARLDINRDSEVEAAEFFRAFEANKFQEPMHSTKQPITMAEYHQRMQHSGEVAAVLMQIPRIDYSSLDSAGRQQVRQTLVSVLAAQTSVKETAVKDLDGASSSLSLYPGEAPAAGRRLVSAGLVVKGRIDVPSDEVADDIIRVITDFSTKQILAQRLQDISANRPAFQGTITAENIRINARKQDSNAFMNIDTDHDGALNKAEFIAATKKFSPPLTEAQAAYAFNGLDADRNQRLSAIEYEGYGIKHFFESPKLLTTPPPRLALEASAPSRITMRDFKGRMASTFQSPQDAFQGMDTNRDGLVDIEEHVASTMSKFNPPLFSSEAYYSFRGLDLDHDGKVAPAEFVKVLGDGHFPNAMQAQAMQLIKERMQASDSAQQHHALRSRRLSGSPLTSFLKLDTNHDGYLDWAEFVKGTSSFHLNRTQAAYAFAGFDTNNDKKVSSREFIGDEDSGHVFQKPGGGHDSEQTAGAPISMSAFKASMSKIYHTPGDAFKGIDSDGDGSLTAQEFEKGARKFSPALSEVQARFAFHGLDSDNNSRVASHEFLENLRTNHFGMVNNNASLGSQNPDLPMTMEAFSSRFQAAGLSPQEAFLHLDANSDGFIGKDEFGHGTKVFKPELSHKETDFVFKGLDVNLDAHICVGEFFGARRLDHFSPTLDELQAVGAVVQRAPGTGPPTVTIAQAPPPLLTCAEFKSRMGSTRPQEAFSAIDTNGDGQLDPHELLESARAFSPPLTNEQAGYTFKGLDSNSDGKVTSSEFFNVLQSGHFRRTPEFANVTVAAFVRAMKAFYKSPSQAFHALDTNNNSFLDLQEFTGCSHAFSPPLTKDEAAFAFDGFDQDRDGKFDIGEFFRVLQSGKFFPRWPITIPKFKERMGAVTPGAAFDALDKDANEFVTHDEFISSAKAFAPPLTTKEAEFIFKGLDSNHDGNLCPGEFFGGVKLERFFQTPQVLKSKGFDVVKPYNCASGKWTVAKQRWCCSHKKLGCDVTLATTTTTASPLGTSLEGNASLSLLDIRKRMGDVQPRDAFDALDNDGDKQLGLPELVKGGAAFTPALTEVQAASAFQKLDGNRDKKVSVAEWVTAIGGGESHQDSITPTVPTANATSSHLDLPTFVRHMASSYEWPLNAFKALDKNKDSSLDQGEFVTGTIGFDSPLKKSQADYAFRGFDANQDKKISSDEFLGIIKIGEFFQTQEAVQHAQSTNGAPNTTRAPITAAEFKERMGAVTPEVAFFEMDKSRDGYLDFNEFMGCAKLFSPPLSKDQAQFAFKGFDSDSDSRVHLTEFVGVLNLGHFFQDPKVVQAHAGKNSTVAEIPKQAAPINVSSFAKRMGPPEKSLEEVFDNLDFNRDHHIDKVELRTGGKTFNPPLTSKESIYAFRGLDSDEDNRVSQKEFFGVLRLGHFFQTPNAVKEAVAGLAGTSTPAPYDCKAGLANWRLGWSDEKMEWCCKHVQLGCKNNKDNGIVQAQPHSTTTTTSTQAASTTTSTSSATTALESTSELGALSTTQVAPPGPHYVNLAEFLEAMLSVYPSAKDMFSRMDEDGNGKATLDDFSRAASKFLPPLSRENASWAFAGFDTDRDNQVEASEFIPIMEDASPSQLGSKGGESARPSSVVSQDEFRQRAEKWAGSMKEACTRMDLEGDGSVNQDELVTSATSFKPAFTREDAREIFKKIDKNKDGELSKEECQRSHKQVAAAVEEFRKNLGTLGPIVRVFRSMDADQDGALSKEEFLDLGAMLRSPSDKEELEDVMDILDEDHSGDINGHEFQVHMKQTTAESSHGRMVPMDDFKRYIGVPAIVQGTAEIAVSLRPESNTPSGEEVANKIGPLFKQSIEKQLGLIVNLASVESMQQGTGGPHDRLVMILWTSDSDSGGSVQSKLHNHAADLEKNIKDRIEGAQLSWFQGGSAAVWTECTLDYYGPAAARLPDGKKLSQRFGQRPGEASANGSPAFVLA